MKHRIIFYNTLQNISLFTRSLAMLVLALALGLPATAQSKPPVKPVSKPVTDTSGRLVLTPKFGPYADSSKTLVPVAKQLLKTDLKVTDNKGGTYQVISFLLAWRKKDMTDNFKTGIPKTILVYRVAEVKDSASIPMAWQNELKESMQPGEELFFDEILVQNTKTKKIFKAPSLRLFVL